MSRWLERSGERSKSLRTSGGRMENANGEAWGIREMAGEEGPVDGL